MAHLKTTVTLKSSVEAWRNGRFLGDRELEEDVEVSGEVVAVGEDEWEVRDVRRIDGQSLWGGEQKRAEDALWEAWSDLGARKQDIEGQSVEALEGA